MKLITEDYAAYTRSLLEKFERNTTEVPEQWVMSDRLSEKITEDGQLQPFFGATSVIMLSQRDTAACRDVQDRLWAKHGDMFVKLNPETFHLTIHAFSNVYSVSSDVEEIRREIAGLEGGIREEFARIAADYAGRTIKMKALGTSVGGRDVISLKFVPCASDDFALLSDLFNRMERLYPLGQPYMPHVSLGYFKIRPYERAEIAALFETLRELNEAPFEIELEVNRFVYQIHYHMNDFRDVFDIASFS